MISWFSYCLGLGSHLEFGDSLQAKVTEQNSVPSSSSIKDSVSMLAVNQGPLADPTGYLSPGGDISYSQVPPAVHRRELKKSVGHWWVNLECYLPHQCAEMM